MMKSITFLLATAILLLSVKSGVDGVTLPKETVDTCCSKKISIKKELSLDHKSKKKNEKKPNKLFQICSSCIMAFVSKQETVKAIEPLVTNSDQTFIYKTLVTDPNISDCWKPPKLV